MKLHIPTTINMDSVVNFVTALFVFVLMLDPADAIFRLKMPLFGLLVVMCAMSYKKITVSGLRGLFVIFGICITTSLIGFLRGTDINWDFGIAIYKGFLMVILLFWSDKLRVLEKLYLPSVIIAVVVIFVYASTLFFPIIESFIFGLSMAKDSPIPILMSRRVFVGINFISVYYKTSPLVLFVAGVFLYRLFNRDGRMLTNLLISVMALTVLFMSGTRMNMLSAAAILGVVLIMRLWKSRRGKIVAIISAVIGLFAMGTVLLMFLGDTGEESLEAKTTLAAAFKNGVNEDPWMLVFGQGPGATFDSLGVRGTQAVQSELTYQDLIRWFGIPFMLAVMIVYAYPILLIYRKRKSLKYAEVLIVAYTLYLTIAGTNPLLITSTGILAMLTMYSYALNPYYETSHE